MAKRRNYESEIEELRKSMGASIERAVRASGTDFADSIIAHASGGHCWRGVLASATYDLVGGNTSDAVEMAGGLQLTHFSTLATDDLPSFDNARMRRGKPSYWVEHGEAQTILATHVAKDIGRDMILACARRVSPYGKDSDYILSVNDLLTRHVIEITNAEYYGQTIDNPNPEELMRIARGQNGLMELAVLLGEKMGQENGYGDHIRDIAKRIARAFQIYDNEVDIEEDRDIERHTTATVLTKPQRQEIYHNDRAEILKSIDEVRQHSLLRYHVERMLPEKI